MLDILGLHRGNQASSGKRPMSQKAGKLKWAEALTTADWPEHRALDSALVTDRKLWPESTRQSLLPILERFA